MTDQTLTTARLAEIVAGTLEGDGSVRLQNIAPPETAGATDVTFAADARRRTALAASKAGAAIVAREDDMAAAMPLIRVDNVQMAVAKLLAHLAPPEDIPAVGVHPSAHVAPDVELADDVRVGPNVVIHPRAKIGPGCVLCANVSVGSDVQIGPGCVLRENVVVWQRCVLGARIRIGPNSVIGYDGFGYNFADGQHHKVTHIGNVVLDDDVEIGACTCIDRAKFGSTRIGPGTKIDNLVQVAHNVQTGRGCLMAGLVGIAGSTTLGNYVVLAGQVGVVDNVNLGDGVICGAAAACLNDIEDGQKVLGMPAIPFRQQQRQIVYISKLGELFKQVKQMEKRLSDLESSEDH